MTFSYHSFCRRNGRQQKEGLHSSTSHRTGEEKERGGYDSYWSDEPNQAVHQKENDRQGRPSDKEAESGPSYHRGDASNYLAASSALSGDWEGFDDGQRSCH